MITKEDCPPQTAPPYPGKWSRENPRGTSVSRSDYIDHLVDNWVKHFEDSQSYQNSTLSHKAKYLVRYLVNVNVNWRKVNAKVATKLLVQAEIRLAGGGCHTGDESHAENDMVDQDGTNRQGEQTNTGRIDAELVGDHRMVEEDMDLTVNEAAIDGDEDMFSEEELTEEEVSRREKELEIERVLKMSDKQLFEENNHIPEVVQKSRKFLERKSEYTERYIEENFSNLSSQGILENLSQTPNIVKESNEIKDKLSHLSLEDKANRTALKAAQDTITVLQNTPGQAARDQVKVITSALTHHTYGTPKLSGVSLRGKKEAKQMKNNFLIGSSSILTPLPKPKRHIFPKEVDDITIQHWIENTVLEPAVHRGKAMMDDKETIPTRYQALTDKEQYSLFQEDCGKEIEEIMRNVAQQKLAKISQWPDSDDKASRTKYYQSLHEKIPGIDFFLERKPKEVKPLHDHTTALCKVCEAAHLNWITLVKTMKTMCQCGSKCCPNWICLCERDQDEEDEVEEEFQNLTGCSCKCNCVDCKKCKVRTSMSCIYEYFEGVSKI